MKIYLLACLNKNKYGSVYGGAEKSIINLANWLADDAENQVCLVSVEGEEKSFDVSKKLTYLGNPILSKNKIVRHLKILWFTRKIIATNKPDVVISFWIQPILYAFLGFSFKTSFFYSERNDPRKEYGIISKFMRWVGLLFVRGVIFQTNDALNYFSKRIRKKSKVIHNPIYIKKNSYPLKGFDNRIVAVGRLTPQKNYFLLLDAFGNVSNSYPSLFLEIYGEGVLHKDLSDYIKKKNLEKKVRLMGAKRNVIDLIYGARLFVMTSIYEGMPNALMEAMALGIPVICSDCPCGGPRELIENGKNGYLFENGNMDDLISKMRILLDMKDSSFLIENERAICESHSSDLIFSQWKNFLNCK